MSYNLKHVLFVLNIYNVIVLKGLTVNRKSNGYDHKPKFQLFIDKTESNRVFLYHNLYNIVKPRRYGVGRGATYV